MICNGTKRRKVCRLLVVPGKNDKPFIIRETDYLAGCDLLLRAGTDGDSIHIKSLPNSIGKLQKPINLDLSCMRKLFSLPEETGDLVSLTELNLRNSNIKSLPNSIGKLQNLIKLDLSHMHKLCSLPEETGDLISLTELDLTFSNIKSLPNSIGKLQNLIKLELSETSELSSLPEETGDLACLTELSLWDSNIESLPNSIGKLQKLKFLDLDSTSKLSSLPEETGDLVSLTELNLRHSNIKSLPNSIGKLQKLKCIDLESTKNLLVLPEKIGDLVSLEMLDLRDSSMQLLPACVGQLNYKNLRKLHIENSCVATLSNSIRKLTNLTHLFLKNAAVLPENDPTDFLVTLLQQCKSILRLDCNLVGDKKRLLHALACNNARHLTEGIMQAMPKLWPHVLNSSTHAFHNHYHPMKFQKPDAVYQHLVDRREPFIILLLDAKNTPCAPVVTDGIA